MNVLGLVPSTSEVYEGAVDILIDGIPLLDMFRQYEAQFSDTINGAYTSVITSGELRASLIKDNGAFTPLACDCGEPECWFVTGEITRVQDFICWGNWSNPYRSDKSKKSKGLYWSYRQFPPIFFHQDQYLSVIESF